MHNIFLWKQVFTVWYLVFPVDRVTICLQAASVRNSWLLTHCLFSVTRQQLLKPFLLLCLQLLLSCLLSAKISAYPLLHPVTYMCMWLVRCKCICKTLIHFIVFLQWIFIGIQNINNSGITTFCRLSKWEASTSSFTRSVFTSDFMSICHSLIQKKTSASKAPHPLTESSPSEPNEHVEIQWILICRYIRTRDKSGGIY